MTRAGLCRCLHPVDVHEHYRPGTDCSLCGCPSWRRQRVRPSDLWRWTKRRAGDARFLAGAGWSWWRGGR